MIDLSLTSDEKDLVDSVRDVAAKEFPPEEGVRAATRPAAAFDEKRWQRIADLGWLGISLPDDRGGIGLGLPQELLVMIELGRVAATGPFVGTALAAHLAPDNDQILAGRRRAGILVGDLVVDAGPGDLAVQVDAAGARLVELGEVTPARPVDDAVPVGRVRGLEVVAQVADAGYQQRLRVLVGGYLVGLAEGTAAMSAEYAKTREQFGRPIGAFQAVKHRCAEMVMRAYPARAQLAVGAVRAQAGDGAGALEVASGFFLAAEAAQQNADDNVQNHGGIGFTAEHPAGVFVKRVMVHRQLAGPLKDVAATILDAA